MQARRHSPSKFAMRPKLRAFFSRSSTVCSDILPGQVKATSAMSVSPSLFGPATMVCGENESGGGMFLGDIAARWGE
jgi:hypothetical protein